MATTHQLKSSSPLLLVVTKLLGLTLGCGEGDTTEEILEDGEIV